MVQILQTPLKYGPTGVANPHTPARAVMRTIKVGLTQSCDRGIELKLSKVTTRCENRRTVKKVWLASSNVRTENVCRHTGLRVVARFEPDSDIWVLVSYMWRFMYRILSTPTTHLFPNLTPGSSGSIES